MKDVHNFVQHVFSANLPVTLKEGLADLFRQHIHRPLSQTRVNMAPLSNDTQLLRCQVLTDAISVIYNAGNFKIATLNSLKTKHIDFIVQHWVSRGNCKGTIENKIGYLQAFASWIGKGPIVKAPDDYPEVKQLQKRSGITVRDKSWAGANVDCAELIKAVSMTDAHVGLQLILQVTFGIRKQESMLLRPHDALLLRNGVRFITICHGTKGGRPREFEVNDREIEILDFAKHFVNERTGSTIPKGYTLDQWKNRYDYVLRSHGITKNGLGITGHGLRHEKLNSMYELITGFPSPVRGGAKPAPEVLSKARKVITEHAGHSMPSKSNAYIGSHAKMQSIVAAKITDEQIRQQLAATGGNKKRTAELLGCSRSYLYGRLKSLDPGLRQDLNLDIAA